MAVGWELKIGGGKEEGETITIERGIRSFDGEAEMSTEVREFLGGRIVKEDMINEGSSTDTSLDVVPVELNAVVDV